MFVKKNTIQRYKGLLLLVGVFLFGASSSLQAAPLPHDAPRIVNYYLAWEIDASAVATLAQWDVLVLDMEVQKRQPHILKQLKKLNPDIVLLVYITPQEIIKQHTTSFSLLRQELGANIPEAWYLHDPSGSRISTWPGTYLLNVTDDAPLVSGQRLNTFMASFVANELVGSGLWDGVFYDNAWTGLSWVLPQAQIDVNYNGSADGSVDQKWVSGMKSLYTQTRNLIGDEYVIVGNGPINTYKNELDGIMIESFHTHQWADIMKVFHDARNGSPVTSDPFVLINENTHNTGNKTDYRRMRFGLGSALLEGGYYSFDFGNQDHGQLWWYDEFDIDLGAALGDAQAIKNGRTSYGADVWRRDFENGVAVLNSNGKTETIDLGGEFEKIHGSQDTSVNDGAIVEEVTLKDKDAILLLKSLDLIDDVLFPNGTFARFLRPDGSRVRNGFFIFDESQKGGKQIARLDIDGNGKRDLVVVSKEKIQAWKDNGQLYMRINPYSANYPGPLQVAIGDLNADGKSEFIVAPSEGHALPVRVYSIHGRQKGKDIYPFGQSYTGGYSVAAGNFYDGKTGQFVVGAGSGHQPIVQLYDFRRQKIKQWSAFEQFFSGGVRVAAGDVNGDGRAEVVVGAGPGKPPVIRVFDRDGNQLYDEIMAYSSVGLPGIDVEVVDVDFDGKDDIVGLSSGI